MCLSDYIKKHLFIYVANIILLFLTFFLLFSKIYIFGINILILFIFIFINLAYFLFRFYQQKKYYQQLSYLITNLEQKTLIATLLGYNNDIEFQLINDIIFNLTKYQEDMICLEKEKNLKVEKYINMWLHEIKTPLATLELMNKDPKVSLELTKINDYIDNILNYSRINNVTIDYRISTNNLDVIVKKAIKNSQNLLINNNVKLNISYNDIFVNCDSKWLEFIIKQILLNSIKYKKDDDLIITIDSKEVDNKIYLSIKDNGLGINKGDLPFVFDEFYTGNNGRISNKSTGMGLYMVKEAARHMNLDIKIDSKINEFTNVTIIFPIYKI